MSRYLKWAFRPVVLIVVSILLVAAAMAVVVPFERGAGRPQALPVGPGEQEIAWLYPATNSTTWERFATAVQQARDRLQGRFPGLEWENEGGGGTAPLAPRIALRWPEGEAGKGRPGTSRLVFRWYKLTSQWTTEAWVEALLARDPPPLAIIGGNNSFWARELAVRLSEAAGETASPSAPLLLLTTATADNVRKVGETGDNPLSSELESEDAGNVPLRSIYGDRTFRFCFSNRQMATAVTRFIWSRPELELAPDSDPAYVIRWNDDAYSRDLALGYMRVLPHRAAESALPQWAFVTGGIGLGLPAPALAAWHTSWFRHESGFLLNVDSSVGTFTAPNPFEANAVQDLLKQLSPTQRRPLLVLTGQQQPSRRLLRDLARSAPDTTRRFVIAMGDSLSFNTIYRDRQATWPIQDLPFSLVFFAHRNPTDPEAGFRRIDESASASRASASGTEDVLLFRDVVEACSLAFRHGGGACPDAAALAEGLRKVRISGDRLTLADEGVKLFDPNGQRAGATGEHIVHLEPHFSGERVQQRGTIQVWARRGDRAWWPVGTPLSVSFNEFEVYHGDRP